MEARSYTRQYINKETSEEVISNQIIDDSSFETEPEELAVNVEYIHLKELDQELHTGIFSL